MVLGSITYNNLNGEDLKRLIRQIINDSSVNKQLNHILETYIVGEVTRADIEYVVRELATRTMTSSTVDLIPIIDAIETKCWNENELRNKSYVRTVLLDKIDETTLYNGIDPRLSEEEKLIAKNKLKADAIAVIDRILGNIDLSNMSVENIFALVKSINNVLGLNFSDEELMLMINALITQKINENNLYMAIKDVAVQGPFDATIKWSSVLIEKFDIVTDAIGKGALTDDQLLQVKANFVASVVDVNGASIYDLTAYRPENIVVIYKDAIKATIEFLTFTSLVTAEWQTTLIERLVPLALAVDLNYLYRGDELIKDDGYFVYHNELLQAIQETGVHLLDTAEIKDTVNKFIDIITDDITLDLNVIVARVKDRLEALSLRPVIVGSDMEVDLTPTNYNTGTTNIEVNEIKLTVNEKDREGYIVKIDDNNISLNVKDVMQQVNTTDYNIKATVIQPKFKVSVFGGSKTDFSTEDAWKVLTNDGENYRWEYVETFFKEGVGLLKSVDNLQARDAIPDRYLTPGMVVYIKSTGVYYTLINLDPKVWDVFHKNELRKYAVVRPVVYKNIKLGHGDVGTDLKIDRIKTTVIDTLGEYKYLSEFVDEMSPNLISFKNVGYKQAYINIDDGLHILNPNSVYETPYDFTMSVKLKGLFNFVGAFVSFDTTSEEVASKCQGKYDNDIPKSLVSPFF